ncbi:MAG: hypothetical protein HPY87_10285 [Fervidobacterium sp.]|uniref:hypothetical protein n=1 Tax=Fervidobacterium sp. TaxID=1871331 RepID=UPI0025B9165C|nr:hypothetical protein [Fervidobacterium sp.]NPU90246.1 hypothetical protein [Fervidobacterium sp.]
MNDIPKENVFYKTNVTYQRGDYISIEIEFHVLDETKEYYISQFDGSIPGYIGIGKKGCKISAQANIVSESEKTRTGWYYAELVHRQRLPHDYDTGAIVSIIKTLINRARRGIIGSANPDNTFFELLCKYISENFTQIVYDKRSNKYWIVGYVPDGTYSKYSAMSGEGKEYMSVMATSNSQALAKIADYMAKKNWDRTLDEWIKSGANIIKREICEPQEHPTLMETIHFYKLQ